MNFKVCCASAWICVLGVGCAEQHAIKSPIAIAPEAKGGNDLRAPMMEHDLLQESIPTSVHILTEGRIQNPPTSSLQLLAGECSQKGTLEGNETGKKLDAMASEYACAEEFMKMFLNAPATHLPVWVEGAATGHTNLFSATYTLRYEGKFRFNGSIISAMQASLPLAVQKCEGPACAHWNDFVKYPLEHGELFLCPENLDAVPLSEAWEVLRFSDFSCTSLMAKSLSGRLSAPFAKILLKEALQADTFWARRNALRVLGTHATSRAFFKSLNI